MMPANRLKVVVFVSGSGSNLQALIDAQSMPQTPYQLIGVVSNKVKVLANERATVAKLPLAVLVDQDAKPLKPMEFEDAALKQLNDWQPDLVVLAGFMKVLSAHFIDSAPAPIINLHPSLLPKYKGLHTHKRALAAGDDWHGCSVHRVIADLDAGEVLTQMHLRISKDLKQTSDDEALAQQVHRLEHRLLPWTVSMLATGLLPLLPNADPTLMPLPLCLLDTQALND